MRILYTASNMVHINNFHLPYIERLRNEGNSVDILSYGGGEDFSVFLEKKSLSVNNIKQVKKIRKIIFNGNYDCIVLNTSLSAFWVRLAMRRIKNRPYVVNIVHGYLFDNKTSFIKRSALLFCEKAMRKYTDDIIVMNREDYEIAKKNKLYGNRLELINGMGFRIADTFNKEPKIRNGIINLTYIAELSSRKNQIFLVKAMKKLNGYKLTLLGEGTEKEKLEKYILKYNLENKVVLAGYTKDIKKYLCNTDIYVSSSKIEGMPFNILEAMYFDLPIVASDIKGHRDLLDKSQLYEEGNENSFIDLIKRTDLTKKEYDIAEYSFEKVFETNLSYMTQSKKNSEKIYSSVNE